LRGTRAEQRRLADHAAMTVTMAMMALLLLLHHSVVA
jgi:hypothetical protein